MLIKCFIISASALVVLGGPINAPQRSDLNLVSNILFNSEKPAQNPGEGANSPNSPPNPDDRGKGSGINTRDGYDASYKPESPSVTQSSGGQSSAGIDCRQFVYTPANTVDKCKALTQGSFKLGSVPIANQVSGYCRWDATSSSCWCPRSKSLCDDVKQCYWNQDLSLTGNPMAYLMLGVNTGECISNAERFYNILSKLLAVRGKKDFAIRINYSSAPARGQLPLGPYGPAIIGGGNLGMSAYGLPLPAISMAPPLGFGYPSMPPLGYQYS